MPHSPITESFGFTGPDGRRIHFQHGGAPPGSGCHSGLLGQAVNGDPLCIWITGDVAFGSNTFVYVVAHEAVHAATFIVPADTTDNEALPGAVDQLVSAVLERYPPPPPDMSHLDDAM